MPRASVVIPAYNVEAYIVGALNSALNQSLQDIEVIVVNDGSTDGTAALLANYVVARDDARLRVIDQANRGLNGARNTGLMAARAPYVGILDADDLWHRDKLATHVAHLDSNPGVGISFSGSRLIADDGQLMGLNQVPQLTDVTVADLIARNPLGNGSAAVLRKSAMMDIAYTPDGETERPWVFDETFAQSTDVECWIRFALLTDWRIEGVPGLLTDYRINHNGLSANIIRQYENWARMIAKMTAIDAARVEPHLRRGKGYQLRYLARRAVNSRDQGLGWQLMRQALTAYPRMLVEEPVRTSVTAAAAMALRYVGVPAYGRMEAAMLSACRAIARPAT